MGKMTISEIKENLSRMEEGDPSLAEFYEDERKGVRRLLESWEKQRVRERRLKEQYAQMLVFEKKAEAAGYEAAAGIDEAGRGPLAGPVVAASVILKKDAYISGLNDSKTLSASRRDELYEEIMESALAAGVGIISAEEIDRLNIYAATKKAMLAAVRDMHIQPDFLLIDAVALGSPYPEEPIIKGDAKSVSIAAASIVAKVTRDRLMAEYDKLYPEYGFARHMGYGTKEHLEKIAECGPCGIHRKTFAPIKDF